MTASIAGSLGTFELGGYTLSYEIRGRSTGQPIVLIHGLLLPSWVNGQVADRLVEHGHQVVLFDLLGHGRSDKPLHASQYRMEYAALQVVALLDHLGLDQAVIGGMSLGANVALETAVAHPARVRAIVCEMPVLERGLSGVAATLLPLLVALRLGGPLVRGLFRAVGRLPRTGNEVFNSILDTAGDPHAMAAVMHGYATGPICPPTSERRRLAVPALIIGHQGDIIHPFDDATALAEELPQARLVRANSFYEMRVRPDRLVAQIAGFLDEVWAPSADRGTEQA